MAANARLAASFSLAALLLAAAASPAAFVTPEWARDNAYSTYQGWDIFSDGAGPNAPNSASSAVDANPHNTNGVANTYDTSGTSFITSGGNIYSYAAPTNIVSTTPDFNLGAGYFTTVLFQTRTQGIEPIYSGLDGYRLTYAGPDGAVTLYPAATAELSRVGSGGMGGSTVDYAVVFDIPASAASFSVYLDASGSSMSLDRVSVDTLTTRVGEYAPLLAGMDPAIGFVSVPGVSAIPEPSSAALGAIALPLLARRRRTA